MKILFFDSWTPGVINYEPIVPLLKAKGIDFKLVHLESVVGSSFAEGAKARLAPSPECEISGIPCRDISLYKGGVIGAMRAESPDAVVILCVGHLSHRVATRAAQTLGIPVVFLMHGVLFEESQIAGHIASLARALRFQWLFKLKRVKKLAWLLFNYLLASGSLAETLWIAWDFAKSPMAFAWNPTTHPSLKVDKALVFAQCDVDTVDRLLKVERARIEVVGNPKLDPLLAFAPSLGADAVKQTLGLKRDYAVFLEQVLVGQNLMTPKQRDQFFLLLRDAAETQGLDLVVKMHPSSVLHDHEKLRVPGLAYVVAKEVGLHDLLFHSRIVLGHNSTALIEALALRRPVVSLSWGGKTLEVSLFDERFGTNVRRPEDLPAKLASVLKAGWVQEDLRALFLPLGDKRARDVIAARIEQVARHHESAGRGAGLNAVPSRSL